jgi:hypothetical protein
MVQATGVLTLADDEQTILADAQGTFLTLTSSVVDSILKDYPGLRGFFGSGK